MRMHACLQVATFKAHILDTLELTARSAYPDLLATGETVLRHMEAHSGMSASESASKSGSKSGSKSASQ